MTSTISPGITRRSSGTIIRTGSPYSMSALFGLPEVVAYSSSKAALTGLTRTLASEYSHTGVRINALAPGYRKQYILWIETAKRTETRTKRLNEAIGLLQKNRKLGMK